MARTSRVSVTESRHKREQQSYICPMGQVHSFAKNLLRRTVTRSTRVGRAPVPRGACDRARTITLNQDHLLRSRFVDDAA